MPEPTEPTISTEVVELRAMVELLTVERNRARDMRDRYRDALESCETVLAQTIAERDRARREVEIANEFDDVDE